VQLPPEPQITTKHPIAGKADLSVFRVHAIGRCSATYKEDAKQEYRDQ